MLEKIIKFGIVGGLGTITNLIIFFILVDKCNWFPTLVSILCFIIAGTQNYILNHLWTFNIENKDIPLSFKMWLKFMLSALCGLAVNLLVMNMFLYFFKWNYKVIPQGIGIIVGMIFNFLCSAFFVFKKGKSRENIMNLKKRFDLLEIFVFLIILLYIIHLFMLVCTQTHQLDIFFASCNDFFADFFNVVRFTANKDVYMNPKGFGYTCYLPLSYMLLYPFLPMADYNNMTLMECWANPVCMMCALFYTSVSLVLFIHSSICLLTKYKCSNIFLIPYLLGNITLFSIERGNWIIITAACVYYFIAFYESENHKYYAALCLVIASILKIYPVFLGLLYIQRKEYKLIIFCFISGIVFALLPFLAFKSGFKAIPTFIETLKWNSETYAIQYNPKFGLPYLFYWFGKAMEKFYGVSVGLSNTLLKVSTFLIRIMCIYSVYLSFKVTDKFYKFSLLIFTILFFPSHSEYYCGLYYYPALILFFVSMNERPKWENILWFIFFVVFFQDVQITYKGILNITRLLVDIATFVAFMFLMIRCSMISFKEK